MNLIRIFLFNLFFLQLVSVAFAQPERKDFLIFNGELRGADGSLSPEASIRLVCGGKNEYLRFDPATGKFQMRVGVNKQ